MSKKDEALKLALGALEYISSHYMSLPKKGCMALAAIEEALAEQPAQQTCLVANEPCKHGSWCSDVYCQEHCKFVEQPAREWNAGVPPLYPEHEPGVSFKAEYEQPAQQEQEPVACDGDFPEGFDASLEIPAQALRAANAIMFDVIGKREWDVPCAAQHLLTFAKKYTSPPASKPWVGLTDEEMRALKQKSVDDGMNRLVSDFEYIRSIEAKLREKNG